MKIREHYIIPVTDTYGNVVLGSDSRSEPLPGSVVLTEGEHGTAWQRHFSDGLWHRTGGGRPKSWATLSRMKNVVLVYDAEERE